MATELDRVRSITKKSHKEPADEPNQSDLTDKISSAESRNAVLQFTCSFFSTRGQFSSIFAQVQKPSRGFAQSISSGISERVGPSATFSVRQSAMGRLMAPATGRTRHTRHSSASLLDKLVHVLLLKIQV